ncbi:DnaJ-like subfamily B member 12 [Senna tora]|uniref:DnaJ-like subfamily B member 12 n=1 Tax=Senna tora TaxID=362788 RepID=A0A834TY26_9FABA|nr:DnaJ-like subfamily B member 12 [Senna tora]
MMDCNKDEAVRAKEIAERKFSDREYAGAKKFAVKALNLYPALDGLSQFLTTLDVYIAAENKVSGEMDWYGILGVNPFDDEETVRKQYRKLALTLHPDKNKSLGAEGAFKLVSEAWSLLSDKTKRLEYNQKRSVKGFQQKTPNHGGSQSEVPSSNGFYNFNKNVTSNMRTGNSNAQARHTSAPRPQKKADTFWTICNRCRTHYEYLRIYLNHRLLCPNCNEAFLAIEKDPPPNYFKSTNWSSRQQHQSSRQHASSGSSGMSSVSKTSFQWGPHSSTAGFGRMDGSSSVASQAASVVQQASEKVRREREGAPSIAEWERSQISKRTDGFFNKVDKTLKKRRTDDTYMNGIKGYMANHTAMGHGAAGTDSRKANWETERSYGFSSMKPNSTRELSLFEIRNMLMDKAQTELRKKLEEWRSMAQSKITNKSKENKGLKSTSHKKSILDNSVYVEGDSLPVTSDNAVKEDQTYVTINVPDPDFHNFDLDRDENSFGEDQVWAAYDDDDGMPRYYARIYKVISLKPFRMKISWLNSRSNSELGPIDWVGAGFTKTCGDFRTGRHEITESLNSFSHKVRWTKGNRGVIRIFPVKGEVWALYRNWSPDWSQHTPDDVIHKYDMVEVLEDFTEEQGVLVTPLIKLDDFRTVFRRQTDPDRVKKIPKEEMFRFSHQVPNYILTGQEADNAPKGCRELDPAATPLDLLQTAEANERSNNVTKPEEDTLSNSPEMEENASETRREPFDTLCKGVINCCKFRNCTVLPHLIEL